MANTQETQEFCLEFIELYELFPCLWKIKSDVYKDRNLKANCYLKLLDKMKERIPNAKKKKKIREEIRQSQREKR